MPNLPPLPKIEGDFELLLDVYTHSSLGSDGAPMNDDYGDTERLAELGSHILNLVVTFHFYSKKPMLTAQEIAEHSNRALSDVNLEAWLDAYQLRHKIRCAPDQKDAIGTPQEIRRFFNTYVGALHIRNGMDTIQEWISRLIDPDYQPERQPSSTSTLDSQMSNTTWSSYPPAQPTGSPPPLPPNIAPSAAGVSSIVSLALVNQTAAQRGVSVTYSAEQTGPPHLPTWTVKCLMNGVEQGQGTGRSQKQAKEEAARQAWVRVKW